MGNKIRPDSFKKIAIPNKVLIETAHELFRYLYEKEKVCGKPCWKEIITKGEIASDPGERKFRLTKPVWIKDGHYRKLIGLWMEVTLTAKVEG